MHLSHLVWERCFRVSQRRFVRSPLDSSPPWRAEAARANTCSGRFSVRRSRIVKSMPPPSAEGRRRPAPCRAALRLAHRPTPRNPSAPVDSSSRLWLPPVPRDLRKSTVDLCGGGSRSTQNQRAEDCAEPLGGMRPWAQRQGGYGGRLVGAVLKVVARDSVAVLCTDLADDRVREGVTTSCEPVPMGMQSL